MYEKNGLEKFMNFSAYSHIFLECLYIWECFGSRLGMYFLSYLNKKTNSIKYHSFQCFISLFSTHIWNCFINFSTSIFFGNDIFVELSNPSTKIDDPKSYRNISLIFRFSNSSWWALKLNFGEFLYFLAAIISF